MLCILSGRVFPTGYACRVPLHGTWTHAPAAVALLLIAQTMMWQQHTRHTWHTLQDMVWFSSFWLVC